MNGIEGAYLQADFQVQLPSSGDNMLAGIRNPRLHAWVRFGQALETLDEFGEVGGVLDLDSDLHDRGYGELHDLHVMSRLGCRECAGLKQELVDADEADNVTCGAIFDWFDVTTHHQHSALYRLDEQVFFLPGNVVWTLNADLWS